MTLKIQNLSVRASDKKILTNINIKINDGEIVAIMGPNGSGKSTLANIIMGNPKYTITSGKIEYNGKDITNMKVADRANLGVFMSFQNPVEFEGITISNFLRNVPEIKKDISAIKLREKISEDSSKLGLNEEFISRYLNKNFSGGEKKKSEILQMISLNPKLILIDEIDSGLDIDALKIVSERIKKFFNKNKKEKIMIIITHYKRIFKYIKPDRVIILKDGKKAIEGKKEIIKEIEKKGYSKIK